MTLEEHIKLHNRIGNYIFLGMVIASIPLGIFLYIQG